MRQNILEKGDLFRNELIDRRDVIGLIFAATLGSALAFLSLGSSTWAAPLPAAQEGQGTRSNTETGHYDSGGVSISTYIAKPSGLGKHPAVIVIHDVQGLTDGIREVTRQFADAGFVAMSPDLLSRVGGTTTPQRSQVAIRGLSLNDPLQDLRAAFAFLQKDPSVDPDKISAVGYGWGGWRSFTLAATQPGLYRAVVYSGVTPSDGLENVQAPVLAHYAEFDFRTTGNAILTENTMKQLGKKYIYYIYPKTDRAFFSEAGPRYDAEASKLAWTRTLEFLRSTS